MTITLQQEIERSSGRKLKIRINDNHSTMLSVRWEPDHTRISLHRMFLGAPRNVMDALACYIKGGRNQHLPPQIKAFIEHQMKQLDYSHVVNKQNLVTVGEHFHLESLYDQVNSEYFDSQLDLQITWYGQGNRRFRSQINFGLYTDALKLVKIHRILDQADIPGYFVEYVVYHEMLHNVCPPYMGSRGNAVVHTSEFKEREKQFKYYREACDWLKRHKHRFFV